MARILNVFIVAVCMLVAFCQARVPMEVNPLRSTRNLQSLWKLEGTAPASAQKIQLTFAVKQSNVDVLEKKLLEVSTPSSPKYGKLLSLREVNQLTAPSTKSVSAVKRFLASYGVVQGIEESSGFIRVTVPVSVAEKMLETKYNTYTSQADENGNVKTVLRCSTYSLPEEVAASVDFVSPTVNFPPVRTAPMVALESSVTAYQNTPNSLRALYGVDSTQGTSNHNARQAVTAFLEQYYTEKDLQNFYKTYYTPLVGTPISAVIGPNGAKGGIEAALDVDYMTTLGSGVPTEFWSFAGRMPDNAENEPFLDWLYAVGNTTDVPYVFSTSYGEDEVTVSFDYASRMNQEFMEGGLRGISFLFASGDSGVGSMTGSCTEFTPQYPSDSPYVTSVGATTSLSPETGASLSSGGFSNRWSQPSWQADAVKHFLTTNSVLPSSSLYNISGRAFPDISAQGTNYVVVNNGVTLPSVAGTSASCPVVAGIIGLLNDARIAAGKSPLGFLNPFIYEHGSLFTDITAGNNPGCGTKGFTASAGWDPVTGWGTPNYTKLVQAALALP